MTTFEMEGTEGEAPPQEFDFTFEVSGKLLWDMKAGHPSEFQFGGDVEMSISVTGDFNGAEVTQKQIFEGEYESAATFE